MYLSSYDASGDDGYPKYSSPLFCLSALYMPYQYWKPNFQKVLDFRKQLKQDFGFPVKQEFHCRQFLMDKRPYHGTYNASTRKQIYFLFLDLISILDLKIINVVIDKTRITSPTYNVLEKGFKYSIQRIENDLSRIDPASKFMIFCDKGRIGKMRRTARKIQRINFIPSIHNPGTSYRKEIERLIEDPIEKDSKESFFIQLADAVACTTYLYSMRQLMDPPKDWPRRVKSVLTYGDEITAMETLKPVLNTKASSSNLFGVVKYPR